MQPHTVPAFDDVQECARLARAVYLKPQRPIAIIQEKNTVAHIWLKDAKLFVVFRGSDDALDFAENIRFAPATLIGPGVGKVHNGFYDHYTTIQPRLTQMLDAILKAYHGICTVFMVGHSLGGAVATIAATLYTLPRTNLSIACITFGTPRVGDHVFVEAFEKHVSVRLRIADDRDPVVCLPPRLWFKRLYVHSFPQAILSNNGESMLITSARETGDSVWQTLKSWFRKDIREHFQVQYVQDVEKHFAS
jgi:pimeloyl-ACP methyl ester carboxylesterase